MSGRRPLHLDPRARFAALAGPGALFIALFLLLPLLSIVVFSFWRTESYELIADWNLDNYRSVLGEWIYLKFLFRSLLMAAAVSGVCLVYAWPCAYLIAKHGGRYRLVLVLLTAAPFLTGILLRITAMQQILGPIGLLDMALTTLGLPPIEALMYTNLASAVGLIYLWIPFMLLAIYLSLLNFNFELLEVAKVCGARPWRAFLEVTWPLNWMGTAIGIVLVFIPTFAASVTPRFLGGPNGAMFGNRLEHQFGATGTWALGSAMGVVMFAASLVVRGRAGVRRDADALLSGGDVPQHLARGARRLHRELHPRVQQFRDHLVPVVHADPVLLGRHARDPERTQGRLLHRLVVPALHVPLEREPLPDRDREPGVRGTRSLLHRHALGQVARLVDVASERQRAVVGEELERDRHHHGVEHVLGAGAPR